jgi:hypothetical protein
MGGVPNAHVVSINRPTPQETIIALVVILTQIIGSSYIELDRSGGTRTTDCRRGIALQLNAADRHLSASVARKLQEDSV